MQNMSKKYCKLLFYLFIHYLRFLLFIDYLLDQFEIIILVVYNKIIKLIMIIK